MIRNLTNIFHDSIKFINPKYYEKYIPKPVLTTQILQLIDKNHDSFKDWGCKFNCFKQHSCSKINPPSRYVCYNIYNTT